MIILGIDPGTASLGYALLKNKKNSPEIITYGCLNTPKNLEPALRLKTLYNGITRLIKQHRPNYLASEQLFFLKNQKTAMRVSQAQGIVLLAAANQKLPVLELTPLQVKQAVTGYGKAEKQQVQKMVKVILKLKEIPKPDDAADALAVAICAFHVLPALKGLTAKK